ncbi:MAG: 4-hydroxybenzoate octaprenyltransferase [Planctomycetota bacterium]|nr:MAG: 4-hydroxybenzoate octaprenyltransferase [Planctomycetota bacterium]REK23680.1 MAG: 4-hydroxybenzoate octaprenyltransferase [Planctomycetota bacterium]REK43527.1 MAG: 4-hydroxybenzoate octaprenyltransferase [Planctomycetota bacterium]
MFASLRKLLELVRFSHTIFALPFALLAAVMAWEVSRAEGGPAWRWRELLGILICMVTARSWAMTVNRIADRRLDATNPRTAGRHLPAGLLSLSTVVAFAVACAVAFVAATLLFLPQNPLPVYLAVPVLAFLAGYSFTKRFTSLAHFWLGAALMLSPICAWIAIRGQQVLADPADLLPSLVLGGGVLLWVAGFDIIYACQDVEADRRAGLFSVPSRLGVPAALRVAAVCHLGTVGLLALLAVVGGFGWIYIGGVVLIAGLLAWEHWLVRPDDLSRVNIAFFNVNAAVSIGIFVVGSLDLWLARF